MDMDVEHHLKKITVLIEKSLFIDAHQLAVSTGLFSSGKTAEECLLRCRLGYHLGDFRRTRVRAYLGQKQFPDDLALASYWSYYLSQTAGSYQTLKYLQFRQASMSAETSPEIKADALSSQALLLATLRDEAAALDAVAEARLLSPDDPWHRVTEARVLSMMDKYDAALMTSRRAVKRYPEFRPAMQQLAHSLILVGKRFEALQLLTAANGHFQSWLVAYDLAELALDEDKYKLAEHALHDMERYAPLADKSVKEILRQTEIELEIHAENYSAAATLASTMEGLYYKHLASNLESIRPEASVGRKILPVDFVRQHHNTCAPAVLSSLTAFWGRPFPMDQIVDDIWYGGTFDYQERRWAEEHGWYAREFCLDWPCVCKLVELGIPFGVSTLSAGSGHLQAVIGIDDIRETLVIRDPYDPNKTELLQKQFFENQLAFGPRAILILPKDKVDLLDELELPEAVAYDHLHAFQLALDGHDRVAALEVLGNMRELSDPVRLVLIAERKLAVYDCNEHAFLNAVEGLIELYPDDATLLIDKQHTLNNLGLSKQCIDWLREVTSREAVHPRLELALASALVGNALYHAEVNRLLRKTRAVLSSDASWHIAMGRYCLMRNDPGRALGHYRTASSLEPAIEQYVRLYIQTAFERHCLEDALAFLRDRYHRMGAHSSAPAIALVQGLDEANRIDEAVALLYESLQGMPNDGDLLLYGASYLQSINRLDESVGLLERASGVSRQADWLRTAARQADFEGDRSRAVDCYQQLLKISPLDIPAIEYIANHLAITEGQQQALDYVGKQAQSSRDYPPMLDVFATFLEEAGDISRAREVVRQRLESAPDDTNLLRELSRLTALSGDNEGALVFCQRLLEVDSLYARNHELHGWLSRRSGDLATAWTAYIKAVRIDIDSDFAVRQLLGLATNSSQGEEVSKLLIDELRQQVIEGNSLPGFQEEGCRVIKDATLRLTLEEALEARPDLWSAWTALINQLLHMDLANDALRVAQRFAEAYPGLPRVWFDLSRVYRQLNNEQDETEALNKAHALNPRWLEPVKRLADIAETSGEWAQYRQLVRDALVYSPRVGVLWGYLASVEEQEGNQAEAIAALEQAVSLDRDYDWAWQQLSRLYNEQGTPELLTERLRSDCENYSGETGVFQRAAFYVEDREEAQSLLFRARELDMLNVDCHIRVVRNLVDMQQYDEAKSEINHLVWAGKVPAEILMLKANILRQRGLLRESRQQLETILAEAPDLQMGWRQLMDWAGDDGDRENYESALQHLSRLEPSKAEYPARLAELLIQDGNNEDARRVLGESFAAHPDDSYTALTYFDFLADSGDLDAAGQVLEVCLARFPWDVTYARAIRLSIQKEDDDQAKAYFDTLLKEEQSDEWALKTALNWLSGRIAVATILSRIEYEMEQAPAKLISGNIARAWGSVLPADDQEDEVIARVVKFANKAEEPEEFLYGLLDGVGGTSTLRKKLLLWIRDNYDAEITRNDRLWANMMYAMHEHFLEQEAAELGAGWRQRTSAPGFGFYYLAASFGIKKQWDECLAVAEHAVALPADHTTPFLHLVMAAYGYVRSRKGLFEECYPLLEEARIGETALYKICRLTMQHLDAKSQQQNLGLVQYVKLINSYDRLGLIDEGMAELAMAHCLELLKDCRMTPFTQWLYRLRQRRLSRALCTAEESA
jgi:tetratricopeptide (TPR) repeat protein